MKSSIEDWISLSEASTLTGYKTATLRTYRQRKLIPSLKLRGKVLFSKSALTKWMKDSAIISTVTVRG